MTTLTTHPPAAIDEQTGSSARRPARVLALFESTPNAVAALREAAEVSADSHLTVVTLAPQSVQPRCCARGPGVEVVNCVVREEAERDLAQARRILGDAADRVTFRSLVGQQDPPLGAWAAEGNFDLILLPARRFGSHPFARRLRRATRAELRLVG